MKNLSLNKKIVFLISIFVVSNFISAGFSLKKLMRSMTVLII